MAESTPESSQDQKRQRNRVVVLIILVILAISLLLLCLRGCSGPVPLVMERFEEGAAEWKVEGDAQGASNDPEYLATDGNPGGCVFANDNAVGGVWYWSAPADFRAEFAAAVLARRDDPKLRMVFDLKQSALDRPFTDSDIILASEALTLTYLHDTPPETEWTHYEIQLDPALWKTAKTDDAPTEAQLTEVMENLGRLWVRGEFREGTDVGHLDNIGLIGGSSDG